MNSKRILLLVLLLGGGSPVAGDEQETGMAVKYAVAQAGRVSLAVYDSQGRMVRPLLYGALHEPGDYSVVWDGLNRYGEPVPAGDYEWRLLHTPGFTREFLDNAGINTSWSPFDVWPGNHSGPTVVLVDEQALYVGASYSEGPPTLLKIALDGSQKQWDSRGLLTSGLAAMARIGNVLYLQIGTRIELLRADNGQLVWTVPKLRRFAEQNIPFTDLLHVGDDRAQKKISPMSFAGGKDFLVVTYANYNEVRLLWPVDDKIDREKTVSVPSPGGVAVTPAGQVFVVSGNEIVQVDRDSANVATVVREIPEPGKLAYDLSLSTHLLVVSAGKCVRRYHVPDGKLVAVYGRPEGRLYGLFANPLDFDDILDLAADHQGGFVTVEQSPRRVAHFRGREKHELVNQWIGGMQWGSMATLDPADSTIVYLSVDLRHLGRGKIDYKTKSWALTHIYPPIDHASWGAGEFQHRDILPAAERQYWEVRHAGEQTFLVNRGGRGGGSVTVLRVDEEGNCLRPVAHLGGLHPNLDRSKLPDWWIAALQRRGVKAPRSFEAAGGYKHFAFSWSDKNQNGLVDIEEIALASVGTRQGFYICSVGPNWDIDVPSGVQGAAWTTVPNEGSLELPVWNWDHARVSRARYPERELAVVHPVPSSIYRDQEGAVYLTVNNQQLAAPSQV